MTPEEADQNVRDLLARHVGFGDRSDDVFETLGEGWMYRARSGETVERLGLVTVVDRDEGDEDSGPIFVVWKIEGLGETRFYRLDGRYVSHDGTYWNGPFRRVQAREKTVLVYEP